MKTLSRPKQLHRKVRQVETLVDGKIASKTKSFTRMDSTEYHPVIDPSTGSGFCDCADFQFRGHLRLCKHILRAFENAARKHQLDEAAASLVAKGMPVFPASQLDENEPVQATDAEYEAYWRGLSDAEIEALAPPVERASVPQVVTCAGCNEPESVCRCWADGIEAEWRAATPQESGEGDSGAADYEGWDECEADDDPEWDEDDARRQSANCPCGRSFPGGDGDTICPRCKITVREAWHDHSRAIEDAARRREEDEG